MVSRRREAGLASVRVLALVLVVLIAAGTWNYQRNLRREAESRASRPLASYSTRDLEALANAYRQEVATASARYDRARTHHAATRDGGLLDEQVHAFEQVQRASGRTREAGATLAEHEASLREVEQELAARGPSESSWQHHLRLLTTF